MDLVKIGKILQELRKEKGLGTVKIVAHFPTAC